MTDQPTPFESEEALDLPTSGMAPENPSVFLSAQSREMYAALKAQDELIRHARWSMSKMYMGALHARSQSGNSESLVQAAHSLRELIEKLPRVLDIIPIGGQGLTYRVEQVVASWTRVESASDGDPEVRTALLTKFHGRFEEFAKWFEEHSARGQELAGQMLEKLDQRGFRLPKRIEKHRAAEWREYEKYFQDISHHRIAALESEFDAHLVGLEEFVLGYLRPRTFEDRQELRKYMTGDGHD